MLQGARPSHAKLSRSIHWLVSTSPKRVFIAHVVLTQLLFLGVRVCAQPPSDNPTRCRHCELHDDTEWRPLSYWQRMHRPPRGLNWGSRRGVRSRRSWPFTYRDFAQRSPDFALKYSPTNIERQLQIGTR